MLGALLCSHVVNLMIQRLFHDSMGTKLESGSVTYLSDRSFINWQISKVISSKRCYWQFDKLIFLILYWLVIIYYYMRNIIINIILLELSLNNFDKLNKYLEILKALNLINPLWIPSWWWCSTSDSVDIKCFVGAVELCSSKRSKGLLDELANLIEWKRAFSQFGLYF